MAITLEELKNKLASQVDEISLLEVLNINAEDIVERFEDRIEQRFGQLSKDFDDDDDDSR